MLCTDSHARDLGATVSLLLAPGTPGSRSAGPGGEWPQAADADNTREARSSPLFLFSIMLKGLLLHCFSRVRLCATPQMAAHQAALSLGFSRQEYWGGLPFPPPGDHSNPGTEPTSPELAGGFFTTKPPGKR